MPTITKPISVAACRRIQTIAISDGTLSEKAKADTPVARPGGQAALFPSLVVATAAALTAKGIDPNIASRTLIVTTILRVQSEGDYVTKYLKDLPPPLAGSASASAKSKPKAAVATKPKATAEPRAKAKSAAKPKGARVRKQAEAKPPEQAEAKVKPPAPESGGTEPDVSAEEPAESAPKQAAPVPAPKPRVEVAETSLPAGCTDEAGADETGTDAETGSEEDPGVDSQQGIDDTELPAENGGKTGAALNRVEPWRGSGPKTPYVHMVGVVSLLIGAMQLLEANDRNNGYKLRQDTLHKLIKDCSQYAQVP